MLEIRLINRGGFGVVHEVEGVLRVRDISRKTREAYLLRPQIMVFGEQADDL